MPKSKVRNVVSVEVEDFHPVATESNWRENRVETKSERKKPNLSAIWELCAVGGLLVGLVSIIVGRNNFGSQSEVPFSLVILLIGIGIAAITGQFCEKESASKRIAGIATLLAGVVLLCLSIVWNKMPGWSWLLSIGLGLTVFGWGLRRLAEEGWLRAISLGLVMVVPFLFLKDSLLPARTLSSWQTSVDQLTFWYAGVWADINKIPFTPIADESVTTKQIGQTAKAGPPRAGKKGDEVVTRVQTPIGIRFSTGIVRTSGAFNNYAGILVAVALSLSISVSARHSLLVTFACISIAIMWWLVFRGGALLSIASRNDFEGPLVEQAMSLAWMFVMFGFILASSLSLGAIVAPIPIDSNQYELSPLTLAYNAVVSFPQLGPSSVGMLTDNVADASVAPQELVESDSDSD